MNNLLILFLYNLRGFPKDLKISALTVKKAYDNLEREGFIVTIHGKGSFIANTNADLLLEEQKKEVEADLEKAVQKAKQCGMSLQEIQDLITLIMEG
ncbi:MAG: GntR family transcriptional regulator, partial [Longicatena sp.]